MKVEEGEEPQKLIRIETNAPIENTILTLIIKKVFLRVKPISYNFQILENDVKDVLYAYLTRCDRSGWSVEYWDVDVISKLRTFRFVM